MDSTGHRNPWTVTEGDVQKMIIAKDEARIDEHLLKNAWTKTSIVYHGWNDDAWSWSRKICKIQQSWLISSWWLPSWRTISWLQSPMMIIKQPNVVRWFMIMPRVLTFGDHHTPMFVAFYSLKENRSTMANNYHWSNPSFMHQKQRVSTEQPSLPIHNDQ